ncbi:type III-B CRISPR-associated protein Cas10/Cmr2 [Ectothiorhodospira haloalkaliphila]|uniref:type III-B CRISPR-associated protein Cas10/Cmr2 n=1 Tax=Ectothiorhodospira haloalkaliphila TaxID=421628 RepID=UPI001EE7AC96|nr:type III-B CRISPR-associated protein Cas10/Cmr2 [Ectothiorhodospira haloalkaliphila]MCG5525872.1 type III-B CRISPR-associated protein Cas10/Cmr2 [Ectothiorhodospira haloalkaliphila]
MSTYFHFTLGPVQGFVAQARRTRDFWAGSFILSWLSTVAMRTCQAQGGEILFPQPDEAFLRAVNGMSDQPPQQGNVPNRFKAKVDEGFDPEIVAKAVRTAWRMLAREVYEHDELDQLEHQAPDIRLIWERQIEAFWDIAWAMTEDATDTAVLDRLKNWRTHLPPDEPGVKCMMMDGWQELSGATAPGTPALRDFWQALRNSGLSGIQTDLRDGESLCAVAYVKRRFVRCFQWVEIPDMPGGWTLHGWKLPAGVPSTHYLAAAPWLTRVLRWADEKPGDELERFHDAAFALTSSHGEMTSNIRCVRQAPGRQFWKALDGSVFYEHMLENPRLWPDTQQANDTLKALHALQKASQCGKPSPFYAVLLMDGDELGKQMSDEHKQSAITGGLATFTTGVQPLVDKHNGFLVYAGGDDVLALLPVADALPAAAAIRTHYLSCFSGTDVQTSISAGIIYAHVQLPLTRVLRESHTLLDDVAKDRTGRDAVACRIWKPGGAPHQWSQPWEVALKEGASALDGLSQHLSRADHADDEFSHRFLYRLMQRLEHCSDNMDDVMADDATLEALITAEYLTTFRAQKPEAEVVEQMVRQLMEQCRPRKRVRNTQGKVEIRPEPGFQRDGLRVLRFLAQHGRTEGEPTHG